MESSKTYLIYDQTGKNIPLYQQMVVGRGIAEEGDENHILFPEPTISRIHIVLEQQGIGKWQLYNKSKNGTLVNSKIVYENIRLMHGDKIHIGKHTLTFCDSISDTMEIRMDRLEEANSSKRSMEAVIFFIYFVLVTFLLWSFTQLFTK